MFLEKYGFNPNIITADITNGTPARITAVHRGKFEFVCENGSGLAVIKQGEFYCGNQNFPTVGDFVMIDWRQDQTCRILETLPRKTYFSRLDPSSAGTAEQVVAANFDYVFILQALDRDFNLRRLERYLTLAWQSGATPVVILTKSDLKKDCSVQLNAAERLAIGNEVLVISSMSGSGLERLGKYLKAGMTIVMLGSSGVGKSSLLNKLAEKEVMATASIRSKDSRGRHTTSHRQLIMLKNGTMIIDTPGMRELGMWDISEGLEQSFTDIEQYFERCKFRDCRHQNEPGCAVKKAIRCGALSNERWESYLRLNAEAKYVSDKSAYLRDKKDWEKDIAKMIRQLKTKPVAYQHTPCHESFICQVCSAAVMPEEAGSKHRNHCPHCLSSLHADNRPGDRSSLCRGIMDPISIWVRSDEEWALIHRCRTCGTLSSNRIAADDNQELLMKIAMRPTNTKSF